MRVSVYTKRGLEIHVFYEVDEIREYTGYYEIVFEGDKPRFKVYGKKNVILIQY